MPDARRLNDEIAQVRAAIREYQESQSGNQVEQDDPVLRALNANLDLLLWMRAREHPEQAGDNLRAALDTYDRETEGDE